jgi:hypothetical protein
VTIGEALAAADTMLERIAEGADIPTFFAQPLSHSEKARVRAAD